MPRKSAAADAIAPLVDARLTRLSPPSDLDPAAAIVWRRLVAATHPTHFTAADIELLQAYVEAAVLAQEAFREMREHGRVVNGRPSPWLTLQEKSVRALSSLAPRLRLGPSARTDPKTTARQQADLRPALYDLLDEQELGRG